MDSVVAPQGLDLGVCATSRTRSALIIPRAVGNSNFTNQNGMDGIAMVLRLCSHCLPRIHFTLSVSGFGSFATPLARGNVYYLTKTPTAKHFGTVHFSALLSSSADAPASAALPSYRCAAKAEERAAKHGFGMGSFSNSLARLLRSWDACH